MSAEPKVSSYKRRTRTEVQELVAAFISSGMRRSEFCRSRRLSFGTLNRHLKEQRLQRKSPSASSAGRLVPVELAPSEVADPVSQLFTPFYGCLTPTLSGRTMFVPG